MARTQSTVISVSNKQLLPLVRTASGIVERRVAIPVLGHLLIKAEDGQIIVVGTKGTDQVNASCATDNVFDTGMMTVPATQFQSILSNLGADAEVRLETGKDCVKLTSGTSSFSMPSCDPETFPLLKTDLKGVSVTIP
ncbi:MAG: hypothetical protein ACI4SY_05850, partial [Sutterella sp.]